MKSIKEKLLINESNSFKGYKSLTMRQTPFEYVIVFPYGGVEMYTKEGLEDVVNDKSEWSDEDMKMSYKLLLKLPANSKWSAIDGPYNENGEMKDTFGIHYKK